MEHTPALLLAVTEGDDEARAALVRAWGPVVLGWCARLGGGAIDVEDVAHEVMLKMLLRLDTLRAPEAFPAWLFSVTRSELNRARRRAWLRRWLPGAPPEQVAPAADPVANDLIRRVHRALDRLDPSLREVLVLCDLEERTDPEAAQLLGLPVGTVKSRLRRARAAFEVEARRLGIPEEP